MFETQHLHPSISHASVMLTLSSRRSDRNTGLTTSRRQNPHFKNLSPVGLPLRLVFESVEEVKAVRWQSVISFPLKSLITSAKSDYIWISSSEREKAGQVIYSRKCDKANRRTNTRWGVFIIQHLQLLWAMVIFKNWIWKKQYLQINISLI